MTKALRQMSSINLYCITFSRRWFIENDENIDDLENFTVQMISSVKFVKKRVSNLQENFDQTYCPVTVISACIVKDDK